MIKQRTLCDRLTGPATARVRRHEPPTIEDAVHAARGLTSDLEQQIEVTAGLMGMSHDQVREHVLQQPLEPGRGGIRVVVVERRETRSSHARRAPSRLTGDW